MSGDFLHTDFATYLAYLGASRTGPPIARLGRRPLRLSSFAASQNSESPERDGRRGRARRFRAISLEFDEDDICVGRTNVLADVRLRRAPDYFVRRFFDLYGAVSDGQPPAEITQSNENAIGVVMRLSSVTGPVHISQYAHAVVLEENFVQLRIGYRGI